MSGTYMQHTNIFFLNIVPLLTGHLNTRPTTLCRRRHVDETFLDVIDHSPAECLHLSYGVSQPLHQTTLGSHIQHCNHGNGIVRKITFINVLFKATFSIVTVGFLMKDNSYERVTTEMVL